MFISSQHRFTFLIRCRASFPPVQNTPVVEARRTETSNAFDQACTALLRKKADIFGQKTNKSPQAERQHDTIQACSAQTQNDPTQLRGLGKLSNEHLDLQSLQLKILSAELQRGSIKCSFCSGDFEDGEEPSLTHLIIARILRPAAVLFCRLKVCSGCIDVVVDIAAGLTSRHSLQSGLHFDVHDRGYYAVLTVYKGMHVNCSSKLCTLLVCFSTCTCCVPGRASPRSR